MTNSDQPAFPTDVKGLWNSGDNCGLTKREFFAAIAMQGMLANPKLFEIMSERLKPEEHGQFLNEAAIEQADNMLAQLEKIKQK